MEKKYIFRRLVFGTPLAIGAVYLFWKWLCLVILFLGYATGEII